MTADMLSLWRESIQKVNLSALYLYAVRTYNVMV